MRRVDFRGGWRHAALALLIAAVAPAFGGCGQHGPARYELSGKVTYGGAPVPRGCIMFLPDGGGPTAVATIIDGAYETKAGEGTIGGPHVAYIEGYAAAPLSPVMAGRPMASSSAGASMPTNTPQAIDGPKKSFGEPLFAPLRLKVDLPQKPATHDFVVPAPEQ